jgi:transaldolase
MTLRLLLDSADPRAWSDWLPSGLFHGVTTNPTLLRRAGRPCHSAELRSLTHQALDLGMEEVHLQAWGPDATALAERGAELAAFAPGRVLVKLPITRQGLEAGRRLIAAGVPLTFTACYQAPQVLLAAALGAHYIAPYLGRISDLGGDGHAELVAMQRALDGVGSSTRLLVASLRTPTDLSRLAAAGLSCFTLSAAIAAALLHSEATTQAAAQFELDAAALHQPEQGPANP